MIQMSLLQTETDSEDRPVASHGRGDRKGAWC